jgi:hypothetical protein
VSMALEEELVGPNKAELPSLKLLHHLNKD